jgi:two-component system, NtrC family, nitrogen regulation response regulator GlnG
MTATAWIIDDDRSIRWVLEKALSKAHINTRCFSDANDILAQLDLNQPDAIITDIRMPGLDGMQLLEKLQQDHPHLAVIIMTAHSDLDSAVNAYEQGAFEYLPKPFDIDEAVERVKRAISHSQQNNSAQANNSSITTTSEIIGQAPAMQEVFTAIGRLSRSQMSVLITGETGTGKELVARALHRHSPRANKPFVAINTADIPGELLDSELFGHEKGAFTGAQTQRIGRFEQASSGTLFLDEIGDMPSDLQTRLLRVLSNGEFYRVGGHSPIKADIRLIAATHQDLESRVNDGLFREDLFHRLNVIRIHVPPLRQRKTDIPLLAEHYLAQSAQELGVPVKRCKAEVLNCFKEATWSGNVRQLANVCRWITVMTPGEYVHLNDLPPELTNSEASPLNVSTATTPTTTNWQDYLSHWAHQHLSQGLENLFSLAQPEFERILIEVAMKHSSGHRQEAAKLLGCGRNTLTRKIKELNITYSGN